MTNIFQAPNLLRISGDVTLLAHFGGLLAVTPYRMPGSDPYDHVTVAFRGLHLEFTAQDARLLSAGLFTAARKVRDFPDLSGIATNMPEDRS